MKFLGRHIDDRAGANLTMYRCFIVMTFLLLIFSPPLVFLAQSKEDIRANEIFEQREFQQMPGLGLNWHALSAFSSDFEKYYNDHFGLRRSLVKLHDNLKYRVFGISPRRTYLVGKDGWFFRGHGNMRVEEGIDTSFDAISDYIGQLQFTPAELAHWKKALERRKAFVERHGGKYLFAVAPTKRMIYPEYLPDMLNMLKGTSRAEQLNAYLRESSSVDVVDLITSLTKSKRTRRSPYLYFKTDFHWNYYGSYWAYRAILDKVQSMFPGIAIRPTPLDDYEIKYKKGWVRGAFVSTFGVDVEDDEYPYLVPRGNNPRLLNVTSANLTMPAGRKNKRIKYTEYTNASDADFDKILILGDSFIQKLVGYFNANSRKTLFCRSVLSFPEALVRDEVHPQLVVQVVMAEYIIIRTL